MYKYINKINQNQKKIYRKIERENLLMNISILLKAFTHTQPHVNRKI